MMNAIRLNGICGDWFVTRNGVKQGDNLSPNLFSSYVNGLIEELLNSQIGVKVGATMFTVLACVDDLVLVAPTQAGLQQLLNITEKWCKK